MFLRVILSSDSQCQLPRATNFSLFGSCHWSAILCSWVCDSPCELIYAISDDIVSKWLNSPCPACHPDPGEEKAGEGQGGDQAVAAVPFSHLLPTTAVFSLQLIRDILTKSVSAGMLDQVLLRGGGWGTVRRRLCQEESPGRQAEPVTVIVSSELMFVFSD